MDAYQSIKRMEKVIESEPNQFLKWRMRKVLAETLRKMQGKG